MATTPNYSFTLPTIGGDQNAWGNELNTNWSSLDGILHNIAGIIPPAFTGAGYLPTTGGQLTGPLYLSGNPTSSMMAAPMGWVLAGFVQKAGDTMSGGLTVNGWLGASGVSTASIYLGVPALSDFYLGITADSGQQRRVITWANQVVEFYTPVSNTWYWQWSGTVVMALDAVSNLTNFGNAFKPGGGPWIASSDDRVKHNVSTYYGGLAEIVQLQPISYEYNGQGGTKADGRTYYGLSAQATRQVMPEMVVPMPPIASPQGSKTTATLPGQLGTDLTALPMALVNAVRELADRVAALENEGRTGA